MMQSSVGEARQVSASPQNKYKVIVWTIEDIKTLLVQLIDEIKTPKKSAANPDEPEREKIVFHSTRKSPMYFRNHIKSKMVTMKRKR